MWTENILKEQFVDRDFNFFDLAFENLINQAIIETDQHFKK